MIPSPRVPRSRRRRLWFGRRWCSGASRSWGRGGRGVAGNGDLVCMNGGVESVQWRRGEATGAAPGDLEVRPRRIGSVLCELGQVEGIK
jgi:hypothetical protein